MPTILRSETKTATINTTGPLIIIGEKISPTGRKKMAAAFHGAGDGLWRDVRYHRPLEDDRRYPCD